MTSLGGLRSYVGRTVPTAGGLLFGRDRLAVFSDAWCQAGRFAGTTQVFPPTLPLTVSLYLKASARCSLGRMPWGLVSL